MREESTISLLSKLPETKSQIDTFTRSFRETVLSGDISDLEMFRIGAIIAGLEKLFKALKSDVLIKDSILEAAERTGQKSFEEGNAKFRIQETGVSYDYTQCGDPEYDYILENYEEWSNKKKDREEFLKNIKPYTEVYGKDGTMLTPPLKRATTQVVITLK